MLLKARDQGVSGAGESYSRPSPKAAASARLRTPDVQPMRCGER